MLSQLGTASRPRWMSDQQCTKLASAQAVVKAGFELSLAATEAQDPAGFNKLLAHVVATLEVNSAYDCLRLLYVLLFFLL